MMNVCVDNRDEIEREFMALVLHKNDILKITCIQPKYLKDKSLGLLLKLCIECYKEFGTINHMKIAEKHADFDISLFFEIFTGVFWYKEAWQEQLAIAEESIIKFYKEDIVNNLNKDLNDKKLSYDDFSDKVEKLNKIKIADKNKKDFLDISDIDLKDSEVKKYIKSGSELLDKKIHGFITGELSVWSGSNGSAKSTYLNQLAIESINQGYNTVIYSGELVAKRLLNWIVMQCAGKKHMSYYEEKNFYYVNSDAKEKILKWLNKKLFIYNNEFGNDAEQIISSIKNVVLKNNVKTVIIDNLMSMDISKFGDNKYDTQGTLIKSLSSLAKELDIHIHFVCHPRKTTSFLRKEDISGSADLTNIADNVFIMHRVSNDFKVRTKEMLKWKDDNPIYEFSNVIEICKNREYGVQDYYIGLHFEIESKRLLDSKDEERKYKWLEE